MIRTSVEAVTACVLVALLLAACGGRTLPSPDLAGDASGVSAPGPGDVLIDGGWPLVAAFVRDAAADGEAVAVNLFASWCEPCADELPLLLDRSRRDDGVRWIGVATRDVRRNATPFVAELQVTWPTVLDVDATTYDALLGVVMPTTAFFDADGRLVQVVDGVLDETTLDAALAAVAP